jgi:hypothetical protein
MGGMAGKPPPPIPKSVPPKRASKSVAPVAVWRGGTSGDALMYAK